MGLYGWYSEGDSDGVRVYLGVDGLEKRVTTVRTSCEPVPYLQGKLYVGELAKWLRNEVPDAWLRKNRATEAFSLVNGRERSWHEFRVLGLPLRTKLDLSRAMAMAYGMSALLWFEQRQQTQAVAPAPPTEVPCRTCGRPNDAGVRTCWCCGNSSV